MDYDTSCVRDKMHAALENKAKCYCTTNNLDYYHEIEDYKSKLKECHNIINKQETEFALSKEQHRKDLIKLNDDISKYKEKFERLHESHKRISRLNHDLEERTLVIIDAFNHEKADLENHYKDTLSKYETSQLFLSEIQDECERYRRDCMVAVQLLQNNPSQFLTRSIDTLPLDLKERLSHLQRDMEINSSFGNKSYVNNNNTHNQSNSYVPMFTYPPTAMIFSDLSKPKNGDQNNICPSALAQVLNPNNSVNNSQMSTQSKITFEIVCVNCGHVTEFRDVSVQTMPDLMLYKTNNQVTQSSNKCGQNLVFDV